MSCVIVAYFCYKLVTKKREGEKKPASKGVGGLKPEYEDSHSSFFFFLFFFSLRGVGHLD